MESPFHRAFRQGQYLRYFRNRQILIIPEDKERAVRWRQVAHGATHDCRLIPHRKRLAHIWAFIHHIGKRLLENKRVGTLAAHIRAYEVYEYFIKPCEERRLPFEKVDVRHCPFQSTESIVFGIRCVSAKAKRRLMQTVAIFGHQSARTRRLVG